ncbi:GTP-binding protein [Planobispora longispora]|uniref:Tetracycline resistance protein n=1 Tax=Planobispora longispora TaxID=28887 RepID=A0A8J3RNI3_9ACTN|nr:GTP-binding protein [Planobispora longispora]GIH78922.1 tetracycline resistance protein [Planobispora longispora]
MPTVNIGVLAHVDAGKTSLTERLLFDSGSIGRLGSVDAGDTQTDTGDIERRRGITIRSAVASFAVGDLQVNLIDTPGHADFVAEVERALGVLDGAILVISAVEGIQAQTRILLRTLRKMRLPTLLFINKIDRMGALQRDILAGLRAVAVNAVAVNAVAADTGAADTGAIGAAGQVRVVPAPLDAEVLAENDDALLEALVEGRDPGPDELRSALAAQTAACLVHPVFHGSAIGGQGVAELMDGIRDLLPVPAPRDGDLRGTIFAVERDRDGRKVSYLRLFSGEVQRRQKLGSGRVTRLQVVGSGGGDRLTAGDIARIWGLSHARVGDRLSPEGSGTSAFAPPSLETVVRAPHPADASRLHAALLWLAEQDPLIGTRVLPGGGTSVLLYGEVQKEVLAERLREEFGVEAAFADSTQVYLERPVGVGEDHTEFDRHGDHDFWATVGLRVEPGTGFTFRREVELGSLSHAFNQAIEDAVRATFLEGLYGWPVTDCTVTLTRSGFQPPLSTAADFRNLTPMVLMSALSRAGTRVYEPCHAFEVEIPPWAFGTVAARLSALGAELADVSPSLITGSLPARLVNEARRHLPGLTRGEAVWWSRPSGDRRVHGRPPTRPRTDGNPLDRVEYLRHLAMP